jgi:hypothetical protein
MKEALHKNKALEATQTILKETVHAGVSIGLGAAAGKVAEVAAAKAGFTALATGIKIDGVFGGYTVGAGTLLGAIVGGFIYLKNRTRRQTTVLEGNPERPVVTETRMRSTNINYTHHATADSGVPDWMQGRTR